MSKWTARPEQVPRLPKKESALAKIREAEFFLDELKRRDHGNSIEFRFQLNAFMAPVKAAGAFLRSHNRTRFEAWEASLKPRDRDVMAVLRGARDLAIHEDGAAFDTQTPTYVPTPGTYAHMFRIRSGDGSMQIMPAVAVCLRALGLVRKALEVV